MLHTRPVKLVTYNIRKCVGLDRRRDPGRILQVINRLEPDVVVLQEADRRLGTRPAALPHQMIEAETDLRPIELDDSGVSLGFHGNAILVRKDLQIGPVQRIELPGTEPRGAVAVDVGDALRVVGVHLGLLRSDRRRQLHTLEAHLDGALPTVIAGDFNEWRKRAGLEPLSRSFEVITPGRSFHSARPVAALDRFALSEGLRLRDTGVFEEQPARIASDHLPVWATLEAAR